MKQWLCLAVHMHADTQLRKSRARTIWPWVLCRLKEGGGVATDAAIDPWRAADDHDLDISEAQAREKIEALKAVGLLIPADGGWTTPNWSAYQSDSTAAERKRAQRERERATIRDVTAVTRDKRDVTQVTAVTPTIQYKTGHTEILPVVEVVGSTPCAPVRAPARETPPPHPMTEVEAAFLEASGGGRLQLNAIEMSALATMVGAHGAPRVVQACREAVLANTRGRVSIRFVEAILNGPPRTQAAGYRADGEVPGPQKQPEGTF